MSSRESKSIDHTRIVVYSPQIYENYRLRSGEGLSALFLLLWLIGDLSGLCGAILGGLVPTVIILACYVSFHRRYLLAWELTHECFNTKKYSICDFTLLAQIYYYRWRRSRWPIDPLYDPPTPNTSTTALASEATFGSDYEDESEPLLSSTRSKISERSVEEGEEALGKLVLRYTFCLLFISAFGIGVWWFDEGQYDSGGRGGDLPIGGWGLGSANALVMNGRQGLDRERLRVWLVQIFGWISAVLYVSGFLN